MMLSPSSWEAYIHLPTCYELSFTCCQWWSLKFCYWIVDSNPEFQQQVKELNKKIGGVTEDLKMRFITLFTSSASLLILWHVPQRLYPTNWIEHEWLVNAEQRRQQRNYTRVWMMFGQKLKQKQRRLAWGVPCFFVDWF